MVNTLSYLFFPLLVTELWGAGVGRDGGGGVGGSLTQDVEFRGEESFLARSWSLLSTSLNSTWQFSNVTPFTRMQFPLPLMSLLIFLSVNIHSDFFLVPAARTP